MTLVCSEPPLAHSKFTSFRVVTDVRCENNDKVLAVRRECFVAAHGDGGANFAVFEGVPVGRMNERQRGSCEDTHHPKCLAMIIVGYPWLSSEQNATEGSTLPLSNPRDKHQLKSMGQKWEYLRDSF